MYENRKEKALKNVLTSMVEEVFVLLKGKNIGSGEYRWLSPHRPSDRSTNIKLTMLGNIL